MKRVWLTAILEHFQKYCSRAAGEPKGAIFLGFGFVSAQSQAQCGGMLLRRSLAKTQKLSLRAGYSIFSNALLIGAMLVAGCNKPSATDTTLPSVSATPEIPTAAQPRLATIKLWIGSEEMITEMALNQVQEQTGMMFRTNMAENEGMLFVFPEPIRASFWMKNTVLPLSAAYISPGGAILEIHDLQPKDTNAVVAATDNIQFVLETRQGWFKRHNIHEGMVINTEKGPLHRVFFQH